jgi:hypothetical protein
LVGEARPGFAVRALEPYVTHWHCQDLFLITQGAPELLSPAFDTRELFAIQGRPGREQRNVTKIRRAR